MKRLFKCDGLRGDLVHMRTALESGEHGFIYFPCELLALTDEYHPATRTAKRLVRSSSHDIKSIVKRIFRGLASDESGDMRYVHYRDGAHLARDIYKLR